MNKIKSEVPLVNEIIDKDIFLAFENSAPWLLPSKETSYPKKSRRLDVEGNFEVDEDGFTIPRSKFLKG